MSEQVDEGTDTKESGADSPDGVNRSDNQSESIIDEDQSHEEKDNNSQSTFERESEQSEAIDQSQDREPKADEQYCSTCGNIVHEDAEICPNCGTGLDNSDSSTVAAALSGVGFFIPILAGAGQVYNGELIKGIALSIIQVINALLIFILIGFITYPIVGLFAVYDAYQNG